MILIALTYGTFRFVSIFGKKLCDGPDIFFPSRRNSKRVCVNNVPKRQFMVHLSSKNFTTYKYESNYNLIPLLFQNLDCSMNSTAMVMVFVIHSILAISNVVMSALVSIIGRKKIFIVIQVDTTL